MQRGPLTGPAHWAPRVPYHLAPGPGCSCGGAGGAGRGGPRCDGQGVRHFCKGGRRAARAAQRWLPALPAARRARPRQAASGARAGCGAEQLAHPAAHPAWPVPGVSCCGDLHTPHQSPCLLSTRKNCCLGDYSLHGTLKTSGELPRPATARCTFQALHSATNLHWNLVVQGHAHGLGLKAGAAARSPHSSGAGAPSCLGPLILFGCAAAHRLGG